MSENQFKSDFFKKMKFQFNRCLCPTWDCDKIAIKAHSIQNSNVLDLMQHNGHVMLLKPRFGGVEPEIKFQSVGRNQATTFTGLCSKHDTEIFKPIDTQIFDPRNKEHLFLLAYRSVTRELHAVMEGAIRLQSTYQDAVSAGRDQPDVSSPLGWKATEELMRAYVMHKHRVKNYDYPYIRKEFDKLSHIVIFLNGQSPVIACSSFFSYERIFADDNFTGVSLNVFPVSSTKSFAVFSYAKDQAVTVRKSLKKVLKARNSDLKKELSKLIITRIENFVVSPNHYASWSIEKRKAVEQAFTATLLDDPDIGDNPHYQLF